MAISGGDGSIVLTTKVDESGLKKGMQQANKFAQMSTNEQRKMAQSLSKVYRQQGLSQSEAQKKAWADLKNNTVATKDLAKATEEVAKKTGQATKATKETEQATEGVVKKTGQATQETKVYGDTAKRSGELAKKTFLAVGKAFLTIGAAAATATVAITKMAVSAYADYEQLVGGVETLFKGSAQKVLAYANDAFYTAGVSANEYMQQVTSFSASLLNSLGGDTEKAADIANMALIDISDNANKMGSSLESITIAYQGFAKGQYMLLDNLKLGYGGTKTEMERLLKDAQALTGVKYDISNLSDVYSAIHAIQEELGIAGTTAKEAEKTITGSANMMKAAWQNVLSAIAGGGDLDRAINNLVFSVSKYFENIVPVVQRSLVGIGRLIEQVAPLLVENVASALIQAIPSLINAVYQMIIGLAKGIWQGIKALFTGGSGNVTADIQTSVGGISDSLSDATTGMEELGNATEKAGKQAQKATAAFDNLQTISSGGSGGGASSLAESLADKIGTPSVTSEMSIISEDESQITFLDEILEKLQPIKEIFLSGFWEGFANADFKPIQTAISSIEQSWKEIFSSEQLQKSAETLKTSFVEAFGKVVGGLASIGTTIATNLVGGFSIYLSDNKEYIQSSIASLFDASALLSESVGNLWATFVDLFSGFASTEGQELTASILTLFSTLGLEIVNFGITAGANFVSAMTDSISAKQADLETGLQNLLKSFSDFLNNLTKNFADTWSKIKTNLQNSSTNLGKLFGQMLTDFLSAVNTWTPQLLEAWSKTFDEMWGDLSLGIEAVTKIWEDFTAILQKLWEDHGTKILEDVGELSISLTKLFQSIYDNILSPIIEPFLENMSWLWDDHISKMIESVGGFIAKLADGAMDMYNKFAVPILTFIQTVIAPAWSFLSENIIGSLGTVLAFLTDGISNITNLFGGLIDWITGIFTGNWKKAWEGIKTVFKTIVDGFVSVFKLPINRMIDLLNGFIAGINKIKIPDWVPAVGGKGFSIPKIPKLAQGAVLPANQPFLAVVGDQRQGTNIEAPANLIKQMAIEAIQESGFSGGQTVREEHYYLDETELMSVIYRLVRGGERLNGENLVIGGAF